MSNRTYVCLDCRIARRAEAALGLITDLRCASCSKPLDELGWTRRIPKKDDTKGWRDLRAHLAAEKAQWEPRRTELGMQRVRKLERLIESSKGASKFQIEKIEAEKRSTERQYNLT
jgi:hypothetical protein